MCLLSYYPPNVQPDVAELWCGARSNEDGYGFAIVVPAESRIIVFKSLSAHEAINRFKEDRAEYPEGPALFHSRLTTHGETSTDNCHPFYVKGDKRTVVAHNGILPAEVQPPRRALTRKTATGVSYQVWESDDPRSDTRVYADTLAWSRFPALDSPKTRKRLEKWLGGGNKLVYLTVDERYETYAYIFNEHLGDWADSGAWHSNSGYCESRHGWGSYVSDWAQELADDEWYAAYREAKDADKWEGAVDSADSWPVTLGGSRNADRVMEALVKRYGVYDARTAEAPTFTTTCPFCEITGVVNSMTGYCWHCYACVLCGEGRIDCSCWYEEEDLTPYRTETLSRALFHEERSEEQLRVGAGASTGKELVPVVFETDAGLVPVVFEGTEG